MSASEHRVAVIGVEAAPALAAQMAGGHHAAQQRRRGHGLAVHPAEGRVGRVQARLVEPAQPERVDHLASEEAWMRAYREINEFEQQLVDDEIILIKLFLSISKDEQLERFKERIDKPKKRWKITAEDIKNRQSWDAYQEAFDDMLNKTSTAHRPWHVVAANNKKHARLDAMQHIASSLAAHVDLDKVELLDPEVDKLARKYLV